MKRNFRNNIWVLGLVGAFTLSTFFCCCFTDLAQADVDTPPCHTTGTSTNPDGHVPDDCDCPQNPVILNTTPSGTLITADHTLTDGPTPVPMSAPSRPMVATLALQPPPLWPDTLPLFLKHSVFRL